MYIYCNSTVYICSVEMKTIDTHALSFLSLILLTVVGVKIIGTYFLGHDVCKKLMSIYV